MLPIQTICSWLLAAAQVSLSDGVNESKVADIDYKPNVYNDHIGLSNVLVKLHQLSLRSSFGESSMVRWDSPNPVENWSFSFTVAEPNLGSNEFAGIYLYYTQDKTTTGAFNGGDEHFNGYVFGLEMKGKAIDLFYGQNDGQNFLHIAEFATRRDSMNPERFRNVKELTFKVIATSLNIKIEVYGDGTLRYDAFKMPNSQGANKAGKYFGIIADYKDCPSNKAFVLKDAQLYQREENGPYNIFKSEMSKIQSKLREKSDIKHNDSDIREFIHKAELVEHLVKFSLGELPRTNITIARDEIEKDIKVVSDKIDMLLMKNRGDEPKNDLSNRLNEFEIKLSQVLRTVNAFEYIVARVTKTQLNNQSNLQYAALVVGIVGLAIFLVKEMSSFTRKTN